jgi:hypothetical protein
MRFAIFLACFFVPFVVFAADPLPGSAAEAQQLLDDFNAAHKSNLVMTATPDMAQGYVMVGNVKIQFAASSGTGPADALRAADTLLTYGPRMQLLMRLRSMPFMVIDTFYSADPQQMSNMARAEAQYRNVLTGEVVTKEIPFISLNTANLAGALPHEIGHALSMSPTCDDKHLCEVMSQLLERSVLPTRAYPSDMVPLVLNVHDTRTGAFDPRNFDTALRGWLVERDRYYWFDYSFGWLLGDALAQRVQRRGATDMPAIAALIERAHGETTAEGVARALGFADYAELNRAMCSRAMPSFIRR